MTELELEQLTPEQAYQILKEGSQTPFWSVVQNEFKMQFEHWQQSLLGHTNSDFILKASGVMQAFDYSRDYPGKFCRMFELQKKQEAEAKEESARQGKGTETHPLRLVTTTED